jgi:uncharacterized protein (TIGR04255 family)
MNENPKLKTNILAEALLEIRFDPIKDFPLIAGDMKNQLKDYPEFENLNVPDFPDPLPEFNNIVRYRFYSADRKNLYNLGKGVLSVNTTDYKGFKEFLGEIETVLKVFKKVSSIESINRIGLRYINKPTSSERTFETMFNIKFTLPREIEKAQVGFNFHSIGKFEKDLLMTRFQTVNPLSQDSVLLDFDYFNEQKSDFDITKITAWLMNAHNHVYDTFKQSLTEDYFKELS